MSREVQVNWRCDWCGSCVSMGEDRSVQPQGWARIAIGNRPTANLSDNDYITHDWQVCGACLGDVVTTANQSGWRPDPVEVVTP